MVINTKDAEASGDGIEHTHGQSEWMKALVGVLVGALLAGGTTIFVSERQLDRNAAEQARQRQTTVSLQQGEIKARETEQRRSTRETAYAEYVRQLDRIYSEMSTVSADISSVQGQTGALASRLESIHTTHDIGLEAAFADYSLAAATVKLEAGPRVAACESNVALAVSSRRLLLARRAAHLQVSTGTPAQGRPQASSGRGQGRTASRFPTAAV